MGQKKKVLLSFDIEEFDMPMEFNHSIPLEEQLKISQFGTTRILDILKKYNAKATFYSTVVFAKNSPEIIARLLEEGHELASHTVNHGEYLKGDAEKSRVMLEELSGQPITGFRMPRMQPIDVEDLQLYTYNSSINPTWLPGRYNHLSAPRTITKTEVYYDLPASVSPNFRVPLFWISFHNFPLWYYKFLLNLTIKKDGYVNLYFHPWEFTDLSKFPFPFYLKRNCNERMVQRFDDLCAWGIEKGFEFVRTDGFVECQTTTFKAPG